MAPPRFQRLVIYGVGLLGGSLGMALKRRAMASEVVGLGRSMERLEKARQYGTIDHAATDPEEAMQGADALIVGLPPRMIRERWAELAPLMNDGMFVTDVGSTKAGIVAAAEATLPPGVRFIGSHPMAGSEKTGAEHGRSDFYENAACILTPSGRTAPETTELATRFWEALGARVITMSPERHDTLLAGISHLPHLLASALMQMLARGEAPMEEIAAIAGGGLRDLTRIAGADPDIWRQILGENAPAVVESLDAYIELLQEWRAALDRAAPDARTLGALFSEGRDAREILDAPLEESK